MKPYFEWCLDWENLFPTFYMLMREKLWNEAKSGKRIRIVKNGEVYEAHLVN